jgi:anti-anti-sigma factor
MRARENGTMLIRSRSQDAITIVDVRGRLSVESGGALREAVRQLMNVERRNFVLNLLDVTAVDAAGLGELAGVFSIVHANGGVVKLVIQCGLVHELLVRTNLLDLMPTFPTEAAAIAGFSTDDEQLDDFVSVTEASP